MKIVTSLLVFIAVSTLVGLIAGFAPSGLIPASSIVSLVLGAISGAILYYKMPTESHRPLHGIDVLLFGIFALAALRSFLWLVFEGAADIKIGSPYNIGDLALHYQFIHYLASGVQFWPESPIFLEGPLRYPIGMDLWNALLLQAGVPLANGLIWTGLLGSGLTAWALWRWAGAFGLATFLFTGGLGGFFVFFPGNFSADDIIEWKNFFLTIFVTQRGFLWALPAGLLLLVCWRARLRNSSVPIPFIAELLLYAALPLFHLHTFLFFSLLLGICFLFAPASRRMEFLRLALWALIPASILVWFVTGGFAVAGGIGWQPGWMQGNRGIWFWIANFGISLPLFLWLAIQLIRRPERAALLIVTTSLTVMILCFLFRFAPWSWDNVKILLWVWLATAPFLYSFVLRPLPPVPQYLLLSILFFSGFSSLLQGFSTRHFYGWVNRSSLAETQALLKNLPIKASRLAVAPDIPHPAALQGFPVAVGYPGHLWSHGYDYQPTELALISLYQQGVDHPLLASVTHLLIGPLERKKYGAVLWHAPPEGWQEVKRTENTVLYERNSPTVPQ